MKLRKKTPQQNQEPVEATTKLKLSRHDGKTFATVVVTVKGAPPVACQYVLEELPFREGQLESFLATWAEIEDAALGQLGFDVVPEPEKKEEK